MKRKILSFVLVLCVTFTITGSAFASNGNGNYEKTKENDMFVMNVAQKADVVMIKQKLSLRALEKVALSQMRYMMEHGIRIFLLKMGNIVLL